MAVRPIHPSRRPEVAAAVRALRDKRLSRFEIMRALGLSDDQLTHLAALDLVRFAARRVSRPEPPPRAFGPNAHGADLPAEAPAPPPVAVDRGTIARWAVERGLAHNARHLDLDAVNAKRRALGLPPFAVRERAAGHGHAPAQATETRP